MWAIPDPMPILIYVPTRLEKINDINLAIMALDKDNALIWNQLIKKLKIVLLINRNDLRCF